MLSNIAAIVVIFLYVCSHFVSVLSPLKEVLPFLSGMAASYLWFE